MSTLLATAANLATDVAAWMSRADLTANIPTYIVLAESKLNRLLRSLEHETRNPAFVLTGEYVPVPADFLEFKHGYVNGNPKVPLEYLSTDLLPTYQGVTSAQYFTMSGTNFRFAPIPDGSTTASISYFVKLPTLSGAGTQTNWLLRDHADCYLYGVLLDASAKIADPEQTQVWRNAVAQVISHIINTDKRKRYGNGMAVRAA